MPRRGAPDGPRTGVRAGCVASRLRRPVRATSTVLAPDGPASRAAPSPTSRIALNAPAADSPAARLERSTPPPRRPRRGPHPPRLQPKPPTGIAPRAAAWAHDQNGSPKSPTPRDDKPPSNRDGSIFAARNALSNASVARRVRATTGSNPAPTAAPARRARGRKDVARATPPHRPRQMIRGRDATAVATPRSGFPCRPRPVSLHQPAVETTRRAAAPRHTPDRGRARAHSSRSRADAARRHRSGFRHRRTQISPRENPVHQEDSTFRDEKCARADRRLPSRPTGQSPRATRFSGAAFRKMKTARKVPALRRRLEKRYSSFPHIPVAEKTRRARFVSAARF